VYLFYIFHLKEHQQKGKNGHPTGIKISGRKITPKPQLEVDGSSMEKNSVFESGPLNSECSDVHSTVTVVYIFIIAGIYGFLSGIVFFVFFHYRLEFEEWFIANCKLLLNHH
jgi:hypothetical protein